MVSIPPYLALLGIFLAAIIGALPPLLWHWSDRQLHLFVSFGAGVFLGTVFFHLIPETVTMESGLLNEFMLLNGFMVALFVERVLVRHTHHDCDDQSAHRHQVVGMSALIGLSIHSLTAGFALGASFSTPSLAFVIFLAIVSHKTVAAFSLATVFKLSEIPLKRAVLMLALFAACTPLGALISLPLVHLIRDIHLTVPTALAAGTFIYVATMDLLPEAFHNTRKRFATFFTLSIGILLMLFITHYEG